MTIPRCSSVQGRWWVRVRVIDRAGNGRWFTLPEATVRTGDHEALHFKPVTYSSQPRSGPVTVCSRKA